MRLTEKMHSISGFGIPHLYLQLRMAWLLVAWFMPACAFGNGMSASIGAGGIVPKEETDIAIAREDLFLSPDEVRVDYVFRSTADSAKTLAMAFPLPKIGTMIEDNPGPLGERLTAAGDNTSDRRDYLDFQVAVNGHPIEPTLRAVAWLDGKDVTQKVHNAGLPLLPRWHTWWQEILPGLSSSKQKALVASGLLDSRGASKEPVWTYQTIFVWQQTFAPGQTRVSIRYRPLTGFTLAGKAPCEDAPSHREAKVAEGDYFYGGYMLTLDYVTTTARYWSGPIGQFNVTVSSGKRQTSEQDQGDNTGTIIAVCPPGMAMDQNGRRHLTVHNYVPKQDIQVYFYRYY